VHTHVYRAPKEACRDCARASNARRWESGCLETVDYRIAEPDATTAFKAK